jgi:hypothetical protein
MKLSDLKKVTVKKHLRIRFALSNGMECVVNEHGIAQVPALRAVPAFNLDDELVGVQAFVVEPAESPDKNKGKPRSQAYTRDQLVALVTAGAVGETVHDDHDD